MSSEHRSGARVSKVVWIDLDNSPHVPFFKPIIGELNMRGYSVMLTARDRFQVCPLADLLGLSYRRIGGSYGRNKVVKLLGLFLRAARLALAALQGKPDLAVSHGSRSQMLAATLLRIPTVLLLDYEYSAWLPFCQPTRIIAVEAIPDGVLEKYARRFSKYPGIKEDVYVPLFKPDPSILQELGVNNRRDVVVTVRPPATEAHYHNPESERLFEAAMDVLDRTPSVRVVLLPRSKKQKTFARKKWSRQLREGKTIIPENTVNGLNLIWHSDLVISGGGTMNREAAALGVPVYSVFRGNIGSVDRYLADTGRLTLLESPEDVRTKVVLARRARSPDPQWPNRDALQIIVGAIASELDADL